MRQGPSKMKKSPKPIVKKIKTVPRETISDPRPTYVYRKDAFNKVKIT